MKPFRLVVVAVMGIVVGGLLILTAQLALITWAAIKAIAWVAGS